MQQNMLDASVDLLKEEENFKVLRVIGEGGYGRVLHIVDQRNGTDKAAKVVVEATPGEEFLWPLLDHPNIVSLYEIIPLFGQFKAFLMPLMDKDLFEVIYESKFVSSSNSFNLKKHYLLDVLRGLEYLHLNGMCHLDLKAENIMISCKNDTAMICDFSTLTKIKDRTKFRFALKQTYLPPEVVSAKRIKNDFDGPAAEMWTFGILSLQIFTLHVLDRQVSNTASFDKTVYPFITRMKRRRNMLFFLRSRHPNTALSLQDVDEFVEFLDYFMCLDPLLRVSATNGQCHPFLKVSSDSKINEKNNNPKGCSLRGFEGQSKMHASEAVQDLSLCAESVFRGISENDSRYVDTIGASDSSLCFSDDSEESLHFAERFRYKSYGVKLENCSIEFHSDQSVLKGTQGIKEPGWNRKKHTNLVRNDSDTQSCIFRSGIWSIENETVVQSLGIGNESFECPVNKSFEFRVDQEKCTFSAVELRESKVIDTHVKSGFYICKQALTPGDFIQSFNHLEIQCPHVQTTLSQSLSGNANISFAEGLDQPIKNKCILSNCCNCDCKQETTIKFCSYWNLTADTDSMPLLSKPTVSKVTHQESMLDDFEVKFNDYHSITSSNPTVHHTAKLDSANIPDVCCVSQDKINILDVTGPIDYSADMKNITSFLEVGVQAVRHKVIYPDTREIQRRSCYSKTGTCYVRRKCYCSNTRTSVREQLLGGCSREERQLRSFEHCDSQFQQNFKVNDRRDLHIDTHCTQVLTSRVHHCDRKDLLANVTESEIMDFSVVSFQIRNETLEVGDSFGEEIKKNWRRSILRRKDARLKTMWKGFKKQFTRRRNSKERSFNLCTKSFC